MSELTSELIVFLRDQQNQVLIQKNDFQQAYEKLTNAYSRGSFTDLLLESGVDVLSTFTKVPLAFAYGSTSPLLEHVTLPNGIVEVGTSAFEYCEPLKSIYLPDTVLEIRGAAFGECSNLETIELPKELTYVGSGVFQWCSNLKTVNFRGNQVELIATRAFKACFLLDHVILPDSVTVVERSAFADCGHLTTLTLGEGLREIFRMAFYGCPLENVYYNNSMEKFKKIRLHEHCGLLGKKVHCLDGDLICEY